MADDPPPIPKHIDDAYYLALREVVGEDLAFAAVDAAWRAICSVSIIVTRCDRGEVLETPLEAPA
jgi:hypothetical protein